MQNAICSVAFVSFIPLLLIVALGKSLDQLDHLILAGYLGVKEKMFVSQLNWDAAVHGKQQCS